MSEASEIEKLKQENEQLRAQLAKKGTDGALHHKKKERKKVDEKEFKAKSELSQKAISIVVFGASGHLARTKTFPALCALFVHDLMPENVSIVGFARTAMSDSAFHDSISGKLKADHDIKRKFLAATSYVSGDYNKEEDFRKLNQHLLDIEKTKGGPDANRVFYFAIPPSVFKDVAEQIKAAAMSATGWNRIVVEKPFGKDSQSSEELSQQLKQCFTEDQLYRIDHYLGKEMVQNLMVLRFANVVFEPIWNRHYISSVLITFKETQGIEGRGQYFDEYGIIRDVMQNHLMQMLALVAMEPPVTMSAEDVRDEKVKVLRAMRPITKDDIVIGQYIADPEKKEPGYQDDPTVPKGSISPTFATAVIYINNPRWEGIPFILKCGKAIDSKKAEVRVQFKHFPGVFNDYAKTPVNELVMRVQPDEAIYLKLNTKSPGLSESTEQSELNLTYHSRFNVHDLPDAYERLILDVLRGDHRLFVRNDELQFAWDVFTPILHEFENNKQAPLPYKFGSRGPEESDTLMKRVGFKRYEGYNWVAPENHSH